MSGAIADCVARALQASANLHDDLHALDLRRTRGTLRAELKAARRDAAEQVQHLYAALQAAGKPAGSSDVDSAAPT